MSKVIDVVNSLFTWNSEYVFKKERFIYWSDIDFSIKNICII